MSVFYFPLAHPLRSPMNRRPQGHRHPQEGHLLAGRPPEGRLRVAEEAAGEACQPRKPSQVQLVCISERLCADGSLTPGSQRAPRGCAHPCGGTLMLLMLYRAMHVPW